MTNLSRQIRKWLLRVVISIGVIIILLLIGIYVGSEAILTKTYDVPFTAIAVPADSAAIQEGERLANVFHCAGCHGANLQGKVFFDAPNIATVIAPNISKTMKVYNDQELERLIRHGVNRQRKAVWMFASTQFYHISDDDLGKLIAYLRTVPESESAVTEETSIKLLGRIGVITGQFVYPAALIDHSAGRVEKDTTTLKLGKYYAQTICATCHGNDLKGVADPAHPTPSLIIAKSYSTDQFTTLLTTGQGITRQDLGLMSSMSKEHFIHFTPREILSIHSYLQTLQ